MEKRRTLVGRFNGRKNWPCIIPQFFPRFLRLLITVQFLGSQDVHSLVVKKDGRTMRNGYLYMYLYIYIIIYLHGIYLCFLYFIIYIYYVFLYLFNVFYIYVHYLIEVVKFIEHSTGIYVLIHTYMYICTRTYLAMLHMHTYIYAKQIDFLPIDLSCRLVDSPPQKAIWKGAVWTHGIPCVGKHI